MAIFKDYVPGNHDRSIEDRRRHRELVEKSIRENLSDILSEESIIGETKDKRVKIPIKGLKEYQFIYGRNSKNVGSGDGSEKRGDKLGSEPEKAFGGKGAGSDEGEDVYETEVSIDDVLEYVMEDLELPDLDKKKYSEIISINSHKKSGYQRHGINPRLAKKRTVIEKLKRRQGVKRALRELGDKEFIKRFPFRSEDLRYNRIKKTSRKEYNAAIICIMDTSGSMDSTKKYLARSFFYVLSKFIRKKYANVEIVFISHTTTGKLVSENDFFHKMESGGTYASSGCNKALEVIAERFEPSVWNIYGFYVSDGDNWLEDNERAVKAIAELTEACNLFAYAEILPEHYGSSIKELLIKSVKSKKFATVTIAKKEELLGALKSILKKEARVVQM